MKWDECVKEAKEELEVTGWVDEDKWDEVINLAKEKYWHGSSFKELKEETIDYADGKCKLCGNGRRLTAHHITYGENEETICLCRSCHRLIHSNRIERYGFVLQLVLMFWDYPYDYIIKNYGYPNLEREVNNCRNEIVKNVNARLKSEKEKD